MSLHALLFYVVALVPGQAQQVPMPALTAAEVRTSGTATRSLPPDLAIATFEVAARGPTLNEAALKAAMTSDAIRRAAVKAGVPEDSVMVRGAVALPWDQATQMDIKANAELRRYDTTVVFRDLVVVRIRDLKRVRAVLDGALAAGAQKLSSLQFSSSRLYETGREALGEATRQARENAALMAEASGGRLGRPLEVTTERGPAANAFYDLRPTYDNTGSRSTGMGLSVRPPNAELRVSVFGRWELLPATDSIPAR